MRFHELGLERTSISYFTGPPGLVDNTAKSITCEDKKPVKQPTTLLYSKAYWSLGKQDQRSTSTQNLQHQQGEWNESSRSMDTQ